MVVAAVIGDLAEQILRLIDPAGCDEDGCSSPRGEGEVGRIAGSAGDLERSLGGDESVLAALVESDCHSTEHVVLEELVTGRPQARQDRVRPGECIVEPTVVHEEYDAASCVDLGSIDQTAPVREDERLLELGDRGRRTLEEPACARQIVAKGRCTPALP